MSTYDDRDTAIARDPGFAQHPQAPAAQQQPYYGYGMHPYGRRFGGGMGRGGWSETKPFFMTSEFLATLLCVVGVAITAAVAADLDSRGSCLLITILVAAYTVSRGIAKAGTRSRATDPRDDVRLPGTHDGTDRV